MQQERSAMFCFGRCYILHGNTENKLVKSNINKQIKEKKIYLFHHEDISSLVYFFGKNSIFCQIKRNCSGLNAITFHCCNFFIAFCYQSTSLLIHFLFLFQHKEMKQKIYLLPLVGFIHMHK